MMELIDGGGRHQRGNRQDKRGPVGRATLTAVSIGAALVLLPPIMLKAVADSVLGTRNTRGKLCEPEESYLIN